MQKSVVYCGYYDPNEYDNNNKEYQVKVRILPSVYQSKYQIGDRVIVVGGPNCSKKIRFYHGWWGIVKKIKNSQIIRSGFADPDHNYKEMHYFRSDGTIYTIWLYCRASMGQDIYLEVKEENIQLMTDIKK